MRASQGEERLTELHTREGSRGEERWTELHS